MIDKLDRDLINRTNKAIGNIRLIATRVKRSHVLDAAQRTEIVVSVLDLWRKYVAVNEESKEISDKGCTFKHDKYTLELIVQATFQADTIYSFLTREKKKSYDQEYKQVWSLLENMHAYLSNILEGSNNHATK